MIPAPSALYLNVSILRPTVKIAFFGPASDRRVCASLPLTLLRSRRIGAAHAAISLSAANES
jgi:hypothetical protein